MPARTLELDFYGVRARLSAPAEAALEDLRRDFAYFRSTGGGGRPDISLELRLRAPAPEKMPRHCSWRWRSARISRQDGRRVIDYEGRALLEYDFAAERGVLRCADLALLHELAYLALLSRVGERLDRQGLHRVHALGFCFRGRGGLLLLPQGGGKSTLAVALLRRAGFGLLSDDIPLLRQARLSAFPLGIGLRHGGGEGIPGRFLRPFARRRFGLKQVVDLSFFRQRVRPSAPLSWILVGGRAPKPSLRDCSRARAAVGLAANLVLGLGTPQVLELLVPQRLAASAAGRARCAAQALAAARCGRFLLGRDPAANAAALEGFLRAPCASSS